MIPAVHILLLLVVILLLGFIPVNTIRWPFKTPSPISHKVKGTSDDENSPSWNLLRSQCFNASGTLVPALEEARRSAPTYIAQVGISAGQDLFVPPKITTVIALGYLAAILARSHADVGQFCRTTGKLLATSPGTHLAVVGRILRLTRFRRWRRLFVRTAVFRLRYQLLFGKICSPRWVASAETTMEKIVQDTAEAARMAQGLFPDLCNEVALIAEGLQWKDWSGCQPETPLHTGWATLWSLDRILNVEFCGRARRVRPGEGRRLGPGFLGWRIPRRIAIRVVKVGSVILAAPIRTARRGSQESMQRMQGEVSGPNPPPLTEGEEGESGTTETRMATAEIQPQGPGVSEEWRPSIPPKGPPIRFYDVTAQPSLGSTLTMSYRALAEFSHGDGRVHDVSKGGPGWIMSVDDADSLGSPVGDGRNPSLRVTLEEQWLRSIVIKRNVPWQLVLAADDIRAARRALRRMTFYAGIDLDFSGVLADIVGAVTRTGDLRLEAKDIDLVRTNLERAGMLGSAVEVPEVVSCPELGPLARRSLLVTAALKGVAISDAYVMEHVAPRGGKERLRFVKGLFAVFGHMCLVDGCFVSNPLPDNLLYMCSGQVGLTDLSSVRKLTSDQKQGLCRLYLTMAELRGEDALNPSPSAEKKARLAMEGVGLVIDLPPAGGIVRGSFLAPSTPATDWMDAETTEGGKRAVHPTAESFRDVSPGDQTAAHRDEAGVGDSSRSSEQRHSSKDEERADVRVNRERGKAGVTEMLEEPAALGEPPSRRSRLTHVMILRGLFDTRSEDALELLGEGVGELLRSMAIRRLPMAMVPVLRMVYNLRGICARLDVDMSLSAPFSRAASKGLAWRLSLTSDRGGGDRSNTVDSSTLG